MQYYKENTQNNGGHQNRETILNTAVKPFFTCTHGNYRPCFRNHAEYPTY